MQKIKNIRRRVKNAMGNSGSRTSSEITFRFNEGDLVTPSRKVQAYECVADMPISIKAGEVCMVMNSDDRRSSQYIRIMHAGRLLRINPGVLRFLEVKP